MKNGRTIILANLLGLIIILTGCTNDEISDHRNHQEVEEAHHKNAQESDNAHHEHGNDDRESTTSSREQVENEAKGAPHPFNEQSLNGLVIENTKNVTRISEADPIRTSIHVAQTVWPATHEQNQPGTVILAPVNNWQQSLAALTLVHHPNDGPLLYVDEEITDEVVMEINRLQPKGNDQGTQVLIIGQYDEKELNKLDQFKVEQIVGENPADFAEKIEEVFFETIGHVHQAVIIGSSEEKAKEYTIPVGNWIAHMNESLLYVEKETIPQETIKALEKREGEAVIYIVGPEEMISEKVASQLGEYGTVQRISGHTSIDQSIAFSTFKDDNNFGWGITSPGHGLVFVSTEIPELAIAAAPFAHLGKHAPMVWLEAGELTESLYKYLAKLKPAFETDPTEGPYNHGYLIGSLDLIPFQTQGVLDEKLEIVSLDGSDHAHH
ncbi:hypothetical protein [Halalkalibacter okhensis]|uniref:ArsR family transcriptional regulator n=1 Tax=Halalkalibacter okhensis TaxID=333138 RepID=A0A0B0IK02_9BACI|nr:hypothetical protein [Halalkalibacter okhensis]KHF40001.1 ArsR family transcriptional regulator [Halalkalibacter okhensis]